MKISIYDYENYRSYLNDYYQSRKTEKGFTLERWAEKLSLGNRSVIANILNGKRNPGHEIKEKFCTYFRFNKTERDYFELLIDLHKYKNDKKIREALTEKIVTLNKKNKVKMFQGQEFQVIAEWYFLPLLERIKKGGVKSSEVNELNREFNFKVTKTQIDSAMIVLLELGLIKKENEVYFVTGKEIGTSEDIASLAIARFHQQMIQNSLIALKKDAVAVRDFSARTFNIHPNNLSKAKKLIREFRSKLHHLVEDNSSESHTYQLNIQLFPILGKNKSKE